MSLDTLWKRKESIRPTTNLTIGDAAMDSVIKTGTEMQMGIEIQVKSISDNIYDISLNFKHHFASETLNKKTVL